MQSPRSGSQALEAAVAGKENHQHNDADEPRNATHWSTRTLATATALETARGEFARGVAMSLLLLLMAMVLTVAIAWLMRTEDER